MYNDGKNEYFTTFVEFFRNGWLYKKISNCITKDMVGDDFFMT